MNSFSANFYNIEQHILSYKCTFVIDMEVKKVIVPIDSIIEEWSMDNKHVIKERINIHGLFKCSLLSEFIYPFPSH